MDSIRVSEAPDPSSILGEATMFEARFVNDADFDTIILNDVITNTSVKIIPSCGAILHAFTVINNGKPLNVIDGYDNAEDFKKNVTAKGFKGSKLSPFACRIKDATYNFEGKEYTTEKFILRGNALHGLLYDATFTVTKTWADENAAGVLLQHEYSGNEKGYPFKYTCTVSYELKKDNALTVITTVTNDDDVKIPIQDGWHPYFGFGGSIDDLLLEFQSKELVEFDPELIPTGKLIPYEEFGSLKKIGNTEFDTCFTVNFAECQPMAVLRDRVQKIQVEIYPEKSYPYLQVYTPPHRKSIALENLSAAPDVFNNGMGTKILLPGEAADFITTYTITLLP